MEVNARDQRRVAESVSLAWYHLALQMQDDGCNGPNITMDSDSTYSSLVFQCLEAYICTPEVQSTLPRALRGLYVRFSPIERLIAQAAISLLGVWEAAFCARSLSISMALNGHGGIRSSHDLRRIITAWSLWWDIQCEAPANGVDASQ